MELGTDGMGHSRSATMLDLYVSPDKEAAAIQRPVTYSDNRPDRWTLPLWDQNARAVRVDLVSHTYAI